MPNGVMLRDNSRMTPDAMRKTLRSEMERVGFKDRGLSLAAGLKAGYVTDLFRKEGEPGVLSFYAIAKVLKRSVEQLIGAAPIADEDHTQFPSVPTAGDILHDANEAAIIGVWRKGNLLTRTQILTALGFKDVPSIADLSAIYSDDPDRKSA